MPGSTSTIPEATSTLTSPRNAVESSTTPPKTGTLAPHTPERPPATVSGTCSLLHRRAISLTSAVVVGFTTTAARRGTLPASAQCIESGHQSRLTSAVALMSVLASQTALS